MISTPRAKSGREKLGSTLVDLFGKKKLEDRILELQAELAKLEGEKFLHFGKA
jgi:uncharacterized small protein (DUF1192 family)